VHRPSRTDGDTPHAVVGRGQGDSQSPLNPHYTSSRLPKATRNYPVNRIYGYTPCIMSNRCAIALRIVKFIVETVANWNQRYGGVEVIRISYYHLNVVFGWFVCTLYLGDQLPRKGDASPHLPEKVFLIHDKSIGGSTHHSGLIGSSSLPQRSCQRVIPLYHARSDTEL